MSALTSRLYVVAWLALATVALGYFAFLFRAAQDPSRTADSTSVFSQSPSEGKSTESSDPAVAQALTRMTTEIEILKSALEAARKENTALTAHVRTLESAFGPSTGSLPPPAQAANEPAPEIETEKEAKSHPAISVEMRPMPVDGFSEELEKAPLPVARPAKTMRTLFAVEIATDLSDGDTQTRWNELRKRHSGLLGRLEPRKVQVPGTEKTTYKLVAGPFKNAAAAALMCARLSIAGLNCSGTVFSGTPLGTVAGR